VLAIHDSPLYYETSEDDHPRAVTHARDHWWTLDSANAFVSPGVNSRAELVPSHGASHRRLGDKMYCEIDIRATKSCIFPLSGVLMEK
jgi:hypothetical protein